MFLDSARAGFHMRSDLLTRVRGVLTQRDFLPCVETTQASNAQSVAAIDSIWLSKKFAMQPNALLQPAPTAS
jgi:hypothetical protein